MAEPYLFIERLDGKPVNVSLLQTIYINPEDTTNLIWYFKNGEIYEEDLATEQEATNRYNDIKGLLLGTTIADLERRITEQQNTITEQAEEIEEKTEQIDSLSISIDEATQTAIDINNEPEE